MAFRYPRRRWRTGPWTLMGASSGNIEVPDEPIVPYSGPGDLGPGRMGYNLGDLENLKKYPDHELWKYGKIPDSATMMPKSSTGAGAGPEKPTSMLKNPFGKMSPEELKDFQEVLKEMRLDIKPEFVAGGREGRTEQYSFLSFDQTPEQKKKREERQSLFSFLA